MKVRQIKKNHYKKHETANGWRWRVRKWQHENSTVTQTQHGLGVEAFIKEIIEQHTQFSKRIERPQPIKAIGESEFVAHVGRVF